MSLVHEVNLSNEYNEATIRIMRSCVRNADKQVRAYCKDVYKAVLQGRTEFPREFSAMKGIETIVRGCANDAELVRDVCSETHVHLCLASNVYSYCEQAETEFDIFDICGELVHEFIEPDGFDFFYCEASNTYKCAR